MGVVVRLKRSTVSFRHLDYALGHAIKSHGHVRIDLKRNANPIRVYLHELLHLKHPSWSESRILKAERKIWKRMTHEQVFRLGKRLFSRKFEKF